MDFQVFTDAKTGTSYTVKDATARAQIPNDISRTQTDAQFVHKNSDNTLTSLFYLRAATAQLAGLMTAAQYTKLANLPTNSALAEQLETITNRLNGLEERLEALEN